MTTFDDLIAQEEQKNKTPSQIATQNNKQQTSTSTFDDLIAQEQHKQVAEPQVTVKPTPQPQSQQPQQHNYFQDAVKAITDTATKAINAIQGKGSVSPIQLDTSAIKSSQPIAKTTNTIKPDLNTPGNGGSSAQMKSTPQSNQQATQDMATFNHVTNVIDTLAKQYIPQTRQQALSMNSDPFSVKGDPVKAVASALPDAWNSVTKATSQEVQQINNLLSAKTTSQKVGQGAQAVAGAVNIPLSGISSLFNSTGQIPLLGSVVKLITLPLTAAGDIAPDITNKIIDSLPISQNAKNNIKPGIGEIASLVAQIALGKATDIGAKEAELTKKYDPQTASTIVNISQDLAQKKQAQEITTNNKVEMTPEQARIHVQGTDLNGTPGGKAILKAADQAEQQGKSLSISTEPNHLPEISAKTPQGNTFGIDLVEPTEITQIDKGGKPIQSSETSALDALATKPIEESKPLLHGSNNTIDAINSEGIHLSRNASKQLGQAAYFTDSAATVVDHGGNYVSINGDNLKLKEFGTLKEQEDFIKQQGTENLADAIRKEGNYDGFSIPNPDPKVGMTYGIVNLDKVNEQVVGKNIAKPTPLNYEELIAQAKGYPRYQEIAGKLQRTSDIIQHNGQEGRNNTGRKELSEAANGGRESTTKNQTGSKNSSSGNQQERTRATEQKVTDHTVKPQKPSFNSAQSRAIQASFTDSMDHVRQNSQNEKELMKGVDAAVSKAETLAKGDKVVLAGVRTALNKEMFGLVGDSGNYKHDYAILQTMKSDNTGIGDYIRSLEGHMARIDEALLKPAQEAAKPLAESSKTLKPVGTGEVKTSKLAERLTKAMGKYKDIPEYSTANAKDQIAMATDLVAKDPKLAFDVAMGTENAPKGMLPAYTFEAIRLKAEEANDITTLHALGTQSTLSLQGTAAGQFIQSFSHIDPESSVANIKALADAKKAAVEKKTGKSVDKALADTLNEIKKTTLKAKKEDWKSFIQSIQC